MWHNLFYYQINNQAYHWLLAVHIISVISWFAGLFYLPRLFVYHAMTENQVTRDTFKTMEYKLNYFIMHPAMALTLVTGILLMHFYFIAHHVLPAWLLIKLFLVVLLLLFQFSCGYHLRLFKADKNSFSHRYFRWFNEIPTVLLILIVILVIIKPFTSA